MENAKDRHETTLGFNYNIDKVCLIETIPSLSLSLSGQLILPSARIHNIL